MAYHSKCDTGPVYANCVLYRGVYSTIPPGVYNVYSTIPPGVYIQPSPQGCIFNQPPRGVYSTTPPGVYIQPPPQGCIFNHPPAYLKSTVWIRHTVKNTTHPTLSVILHQTYIYIPFILRQFSYYPNPVRPVLTKYYDRRFETPLSTQVRLHTTFFLLL